jgi:O-antigen/teichoic acid export membrane protein
MQVPSLLGSLLMAYFITADTEGDHARLENFFRSVLPALTLGLSVAAAIGALSGSLLIHAFFGDEFGRARALLWPLLAAAALAAPVTLAFGPAANARSRTSIAAMAAIVSAATNTLLNFLLIPAFGISGCAWATTAAFGGSLLMFLSLAPREISAHRGWTLYAALPVLAGAVLGAQGREWSGLGVALSASAALGAFHARDVRGALQAFFSLPAIESMFLVGRGARARMEVR